MSNCLLGFQQFIIKDIDQVEKDQLLQLFLSHPKPPDTRLQKTPDFKI